MSVRGRAGRGIDVAAVLRARLGTRARSVVLVDRQGMLTGQDLLDLVRLRREHPRHGLLHGPAHPAARTVAHLPAAQDPGALSATAPLRQVLVAVLAADGEVVLRSSGSTGAPRLQRRGPLTPAQLRCLLDLGRRVGLRRGRLVACLAPGVHGHGLLLALGALAVGAPLVDLAHLPAADRIALLHRTSPDLLTGAPVHLAALLRAEQALVRGRPLAIPRIVSGSGPLTEELRADLSRHFRARVHDVYGTTETGPLSVDGRPLRGVHLRELEGLLVARTPFTAGRELVTDRGELAWGERVRVLGRADATLTAGGRLPDPPATLRVLRAHPAVGSARLLVEADERTGVHTLAEVVLDPSAARTTAVSPEDLRALVHDRLGASAVPDGFRLLR